MSFTIEIVSLKIANSLLLNVYLSVPHSHDRNMHKIIKLSFSSLFLHSVIFLKVPYMRNIHTTSH
jgi:hypothetical protein